MPRRLTPSSALENAKREAKRWLKALKAALTSDSAPDTLTVAHFDRVAADLVEAYRTGDPAMMRSVWRNFGHMRSWQGMRTYVQLDLGKRPDADGTQPDVTLDDARLLTARANDFPTWQALVDHVESRAQNNPSIIARPVAVFSAGSKRAKSHVSHTRDWDAALGLLREREAPGLDATGQITDELLERVSHIENLEWLEINASPGVTDDGLRHLARLPRLRHLDVSGCRISDRGIAVLADLPELRSVSLAWTGVTDDGAAVLANCPLIERVNLTNTRTGDGAVKALVGKQHLSHFNSGSLLSDDGLHLFRNFPVYQSWRGGEPNDRVYDPEPNSLFLRGTFTDRGLAELASLEGLYALNIDDRALAVTAAGLASLVDLPHLESLAVDATDAMMPHIAAMKKLRLLAIQDTVAGDDGFVALSKSQSIEMIWGRRCHNLRSRGFAALADMPRLRTLGVSCLNVDDSAVATLPAFPALRELMPMDIPDAGYRHIAKCRDLEVLTLMYCRETGDLATEHITTMPKLEKYFASYTKITDRTPELLSRIESLESVELSACAGLTNAGIATLAWLPNLREVTLGGMSNVTSEVISAFPARVRVSYSPSPTR